MSQSLNQRSQPHIASEQEEAGTRYRLSGPWNTQSVAAVLPELKRLGGERPDAAIFDLTGVSVMDTAGALLLLRTEGALASAGIATAIEGAPPATQRILEIVRAHRDAKVAPSPKGGDGLRYLLEEVGAATFEVGRKAREIVAFLGLVIETIGHSLLKPGRIRFTSLVSQMEQSGVNALPIVGLISFLIGVVLAFQGADQLRTFGAQIFTLNLVAIGVLREMGILLTAIIVAGRSGSAFTAQIGTMKVNEEIDAMRTIGLDPIEVLVLPRVLGLVIVLPLLTFYADLMGLIGGAVMTMTSLDISLFQYIRYLQDATDLNDFFVGMIKAPIFAFIIALIGCHEGLQVSRSAESVGKQTTRAVVEAIFLVIVLDALLSILFSLIGV